MGETAVISYNGDGYYRISLDFDDNTTEIILFSYISDKTLSKISTSHRKKNTFGNIIGCVFKVHDVWDEFKETLGSFEKVNYISEKDFEAKYELISDTGIISSETYVDEKYTPKNPENMDGKLSVSTTLYSIDLRRRLSNKNKENLKEVLKYQLGYYRNNGFPNRPSHAPHLAIENTIRY